MLKKKQEFQAERVLELAEIIHKEKEFHSGGQWELIKVIKQ